MSEDIVKLAESIAEAAHSGQYRRDRHTPYINHCRDVVARLQAQLNLQFDFKDSKILLAVAWLHDVLEDTLETKESLSEKRIPLRVIAEVSLLTRSPEINYDDYLSRVATSQIATAVKLADMESNLSDAPSGNQKIRYRKGRQFLIDTLSK